MTASRIHRIAAMPTASLHLETLGNVLSRIKFEDGLHDRDLGEVLGKSKDRAEIARAGNADISALSLIRGLAQWGPRLDPILLNAGVVTRLAMPGPLDESAPRILTAALLKIITALEDGRGVEPHELRDAAPEIHALCRLSEQLACELAKASAR